MSYEKEYFAETYEENRAKFRNLLAPIKEIWPNTELHQLSIDPPSDDLTIDVLRASPSDRYDKLLFISTGLHGIEGYIGAAVQHLFAVEFLKLLNPLNTGVCFIHAVNPWGMKNRRRVNEHNVDLNRNFNYDESGKLDLVNSAYDRAGYLLNPDRALKRPNSLFFYLRLLNLILSMGPAVFREAVLFGQYRYPKGLYYGGSSLEPSSEQMNNLFRNAIQPYRQVLYIDMHSGYGPREQMTLVNSTYERRDSASLQKAFEYPLVVKTDPEEFYQMRGDMVDYFYQVMDNHYADKNFFGTSFEFGTFGESFLAVIKSLRVMVNENRLFHHGAVSEKVAERARVEFEALFNPPDDEWKEKALHDARQAFKGILKAEGFVYNGV